MSLFLGAFFLGKRSNRDEAVLWRENFDAEHTKCTRVEATLVEKDVLLATKDESIASQSGRLEEKDRIISGLGGTRVAELLLQQHEQNLSLFGTLTLSLDNHEARAAERHVEIADVLRKLNRKES